MRLVTYVRGLEIAANKSFNRALTFKSNAFDADVLVRTHVTLEIQVFSTSGLERLDWKLDDRLDKALTERQTELHVRSAGRGYAGLTLQG